MKKSFLSVCLLMTLGFLFLMAPAKAFAVPVLQVYAEGGTAGDMVMGANTDFDTWFTSNKTIGLNVVLWKDGYQDPADMIKDLYLLVTVPDGQAAPTITGATYAGEYTGTYPNSHFPVNKPGFDFYKYLIEATVVFPIPLVTQLPNYDATGAGPWVPNYDSITNKPGGKIYELSVQLADAATYAHFDAYATGLDYEWKKVSGNWQWILKTTNTEFSPGSHDSSYAPVPEPATMLLLGSGLLGLAGFGRKKLFKKA
jgi:hypothetical protein